MEGQQIFGKRFEKIIEGLNDKANSITDVVTIYEDWAETYENDERALGYCMHGLFVDFLEQMIGSENGFTKSSSILDLAAGTGLVGQQLREKGFDGQIDAHDGSKNMLEIAKKKDVYQRFICHIIEPQTSMPKELASGFHDILLMCGALINSSHVHYENLKQLLSSVRVGGLILFTIRMPKTLLDFEFRCELEREAFNLEDKGYWQLIDMKLSKNYRNLPDHELEKRHHPRMLMCCYKKLKNLKE